MAPPGDLAGQAVRALGAWETLRTTCTTRDRDGRVLVREGPSGGRAPVWPVSQVLAAAADVAAIAEDRIESMSSLGALLDALEPYRAGDGYAPIPGRRRRYYDDNAWIGLCLAQLHLQTQDPSHLDHARRLFRFVVQGQDPDGGVRWVEGRRARHTCAAAPAAELALRLHLIDGDGASLTFARRTLAWLDRTLRLPGQLYADHIDRRGRIDRTLWTYNQGAAAGAHALLHRATGQGEPRAQALRTARAGLRTFRGDRVWRHPPVFNAVFFRNLLALHAIEPVPGLQAALSAYLDRAWREGRDPRTRVFTAGGIGSYDGKPAIDQAGLVQLLALRAWPPERWPDIC